MEDHKVDYIVDKLEQDLEILQKKVLILKKKIYDNYGKKVSYESERQAVVDELKNVLANRQKNAD